MGYLLRGMRYVFGEKQLRPYVWGPMVFAGLLFVAVSAAAYAWLVPMAEDVLFRLTGLSQESSAFLSRLTFFVFWWVVSSVVYVAIAGILSSFLWEKLSREIERLEGSLPSPEAKVGCLATLADTVIRGGIALFVSLAALALGWVCFGLVGVVLAGWLGLLDYTSCAFARRGVLIQGQLVQVYRCPGWGGFLISAGVVALFPILNVLMLPALVAGGTLLCARRP